MQDSVQHLDTWYETLVQTGDKCTMFWMNVQKKVSHQVSASTLTTTKVHNSIVIWIFTVNFRILHMTSE